MAYKSMRDFIEAVDKAGGVKHVDGAHWNLELGGIIELSAEREGPLLLFDNIADYPEGHRVAGNLYQTTERFCIALGLPPDTPKLDLVRKFRGLGMNKLIQPKTVNQGPVMENVVTGKDVNVLDFPIPKYHEKDGGRYIGTGLTVITRHPDSGWVNVGVQRCMVQDEQTLSIHFAPGKHGKLISENYYSANKPCPVALTFGPDPILYMSSVLSVPQGISELDFAGMIKGEPIEVLNGELTGLPLPAHDEMIIEGEMYPPEGQSLIEGPFGEWTGYYGSGARVNPTIKVKAIYYRNNPIHAASPPLKPSLWKFAGFPVPVTCAPPTWDALEAAGVSGIQGVWFMEGGGERFIPVVSIKQQHPGHAKRAAYITAGCHGAGYLSRIIIVVDEDIDPTNTDDVLWAVVTRCDFDRDIDILKGTWSGGLDPIIPAERKQKGDVTTNKLLIDACRPFSWKSSFPEVNEISEVSRKNILEKWKDLFQS